MKLVGVSEDERNVARQIQRDVDAARANGIAGDVEGCRHHVVYRHRTAFRLLLPCHGEEGSHDAAAPLGCGPDLQRGGLGSRVALFLEHHGTGHDNGKWIVEFVSDARQQGTQRGELFALVQGLALARQLPGGALLFRDVTCDGQHVRFPLVLHRDPVHFEFQCRAILALLRHLRVKCLSLGDCSQKLLGIRRADPDVRRQCRELVGL